METWETKSPFFPLFFFCCFLLLLWGGGGNSGEKTRLVIGRSEELCWFENRLNTCRIWTKAELEAQQGEREKETEIGGIIDNFFQNRRRVNTRN